MQAAELSSSEVELLRPRTPRVLCHLAALAAVATLATYMAILTRYFDDLALINVPGALLTGAVPVALMFPFFSRIGIHRWSAFAAGALIPFVPLVLAWHVGFRMASLPYRDWKPRIDEYPRIRSIPGTDYYVVLREDAASPVTADASSAA